MEGLQVLGLREYTRPDGGKSLKHAFFERGIRAQNVEEVLRDSEKLIQNIPDNERYNIYFSVHNCHGKSPRDFKDQWVIPFDLDDIDLTKVQETAQAVCEGLGIKYEKTGIVMSGHGLQFFVQTETSITDTDYFAKNRENYKRLLYNISVALEKHKLPGNPDPSVFSPRRLMRMPGTINRKPHKGPDVRSYVLQANIEIQKFFLNGSTDDGPEKNQRQELSSAEKTCWGEVASQIVPDGQRNQTITRLFGYLLSRGVCPVVASTMSFAYNRVFCSPSLPDSEVESIFNSICKREFDKKGGGYQ